MGLLLALRFLTALPLPAAEVKPLQMGRAAAFFPLVGALVGAAVAGVDAGLRLAFPASVASAGALVALVLLTGGLHLDGLMDSCDGLFGRRDPARRLEIMRDSRAGSFGVLGAVCVLLLKFVALLELPAPWLLGGIVAATSVARGAMVLAIWGFPYARVDGLGRAFKDGIGVPQVAAATVTAAVLALGLLQWRGVVVLVLAALATLLSGLFICTRIPGLTGDTYGAINEVVEVLVLLALVSLGQDYA